MDLGLLYSGGKDSTLAALLLEDFYDVTLVTATFGVADAWDHARRTAEELGFEFETVELDDEVAAEAVEQMVADGYPRNGIQRVHEHALETIAALDVDAIADGTRRDDRVRVGGDARVPESPRACDECQHAPLVGEDDGAVVADGHRSAPTGVQVRDERREGVFAEAAEPPLERPHRDGWHVLT